MSEKMLYPGGKVALSLKNSWSGIVPVPIRTSILIEVKMSRGSSGRASWYSCAGSVWV
jgi:hypothetical protein